MFYRQDNEPIESLGGYLGVQLRERLRVALDFATLGAYELTAPEGDAELAAPALSREPLERELPQRVFLFAKVAPSCPASRGADRPRCAVDAGARRAARDRPARRRGGVRAPEQPCLCAVAAKSRA
jgi:hypothetical protein